MTSKYITKKKEWIKKKDKPELKTSQGQAGLQQKLKEPKTEWIKKSKKTYITKKKDYETGEHYAVGGIAKIVGKKAVDWIKKNRRAITKDLHSPEGKAKTQELTEKLKKGMGKAGGGRATHGYGRAYMKGGRAR